MTIGQLIRHIREEMGLSQSALAEDCYVTQGVWSKIERGTLTPSMDILTALCKKSKDFVLLAYTCGRSAAEAIQNILQEPMPLKMA